MTKAPFRLSRIETLQIAVCPKCDSSTVDRCEPSGGKHSEAGEEL
jgi:hypothetical protein